MPKIKPKKIWSKSVKKPARVNIVYEDRKSTFNTRESLLAWYWIPDTVIAEELVSSQTYRAYRNANVYKVVEIKDAYEWKIIYDWTEAVGFIELTEAIVYMHDRIKRFPNKRYDILPM